LTEQSDEGRICWLWNIVFPTKTAILIAIFVCVIVPTGLIAVHIKKNPAFSPIDEFAHYGYVVDLKDGHFPRVGETVSQSVLRTISCAGLDLPGFTVPPCNARKLEPTEYPGSGLLTEAVQPPTYYAVTAILSWIPIHILGFSGLVGTRGVGAVWFALGLLLLWGTGRLLDLSPQRIGAGVLLLATAPTCIYFESIVNNDAASIFAGSLMAFIAALAWRRPGRWVPWTFALVAFGVSTIKATDFLPVLVVSLLFLILYWQRYKEAGARPFTNMRKVLRVWLPHGGVLVGSGLLSLIAWWMILRHLTIVPESLICKLTQSPPGPPFAEIFYDPLTMWQPITGSQLASAISSSQAFIEEIFNTILSYALVAAAASALFVKRRTWAHWTGLLSLAALYLGGLALGILSWANCGVPVGTEGRYGLCLASMLILVLMALIRGKIVLRAIWIFGLASLALDVWLMVFT
jgi:hypothetical protein